MKKLFERADALDTWLRRCLLAVISSEGLFLAIMFLFNGVFSTDLFMAVRYLLAPLEQYVLRPWAGAMLALFLVGRKNGCLELWPLALVALWLLATFAFRFGTEVSTMEPWLNYTICFFVLYGSVRQADTAHRERQMDIACFGIALISLAVGGALLYCAWTGRTFFSYSDTVYFGVVKGQLQHATHYNTTGMFALSCVMFCVLGLSRSKSVPAVLYYLAAAAVMALVVVLTQSRTARYAMLAAFAVGVWSELGDRLRIRRTALRHAAALACAGAVLVGGYVWCSLVTDAALAHYAGKPVPEAEMFVPSAFAQGEADDSTEPMQARPALNATFSDRTNIWKNVFKNWKNEPKYMLIGNGYGRSQWLVTEDTIHESYGHSSIHNAYLQFAADYGVLAFGLIALFLLMIVPSALRVFFARGAARLRGGSALCMAVVAALITGMMESAPLEAMTPMNMMLFFTLAQLMAAGRETRAASEKPADTQRRA